MTTNPLDSKNCKIDAPPDYFEVIRGTYQDYQILAHYHYLQENIKPVTEIYKITGKGKWKPILPDPIGVVCFKQPLTNIRPRRTATKRYFTRPKTIQARLKLINKKILYLARIIIDPRYQKKGLGTWLLLSTLEQMTIPIIETLTPIDFTDKLFHKVGFKRYLTPAPQHYKKFTDAMLEIGIQESWYRVPWFIENRLRQLEPNTKKTIEKTIVDFLNHFKNAKDLPPGMERTKLFCSKIPYPECYQVWFNPRVLQYDETPPFFAEKSR